MKIIHLILESIGMVTVAVFLIAFLIGLFGDDRDDGDWGNGSHIS